MTDRYDFPCTPDCPLEIWADWLEDQGIDPGEVRLLALGWISPGYSHFFRYGHGSIHGCPEFNHDYSYEDTTGISYGYGLGNGMTSGHEFHQGDGFLEPSFQQY